MTTAQDPAAGRMAVQRVLAAAGIDRVASCEPVGGGTANAVWRVGLAGRPGLVVKVAPAADLPALSHERDLLRTEALFCSLAAPVAPVPAVVHVDLSRSVVAGDVLVVAELPGENLASVRDRATPGELAGVRRALGGAVAALHGITGDAFGYPTAPARTWRAAFTGVVDVLLADADRYAAPLPSGTDRIRAAVHRHAALLDEVAVPVLVHHDLWEGNLLVDGGRLTGIVDGERALWGDPLADLASLAIFGDMEADAAFLDGYRSAGGSLVFGRSERLRVALYRLHLFTVMLAEAVPRGYAGPAHDRQVVRVSAGLLRMLELLEG